MKTPTLRFSLMLAMTLIVSALIAQTVKEGFQPLSKKAQNGYMDEAKFDPNGNVNIVYKIGGDKKKDELFFEQYTFDKDLKFLETKSVNEPKTATMPDKEATFMSAYVGGKTSFDILSMKLRVHIRKVKQKWDYKKQRYVTDDVISDETVKLKNEEGRAYYGVDQYRSDETGDFIVLAYYETKDKKNPNQFVLLTITFDGDVKEKPIDINGPYSLVFCSEISEDAPGKNVGKQDFIMVMAPRKGAPDPSAYVLLHYDIKGTLKNKVEFKSPSPNLLVNSVNVKDGDVYFSGLSVKEMIPYDAVFEEYMPIENPFYRGGNENAQMDRYAKRANEEMDNFHLLKFSGNKLIFATTANVSDFKAKTKSAPSEKSGKIYKGKKFHVTAFNVTPSNEYIIAGQLTFRVNIGDLKNPFYQKAYGDIVCFHFDAQGNLKSEYAVDKVFEDKKSEVFDMPQKFFLSGDGKYAYWEIMEVKGYKGYANFWEAYGGRKSFHARYFPRITKMNLENGSLSDFKYPGQKKFFVYGDGYFFNPETLTRTYVGRDDDHENLWVGKVIFD